MTVDSLALRAATCPDGGSASPSVAPVRRGRADFRHRLSAGRGRRWAAALVACSMLCSLVSRPAHAEPGSGIPDTGSRPVASGTLTMPNGGSAISTPPSTSTSSSPALGPLATQLAALETAVNALGQKRLKASLDLEAAQAAQADTVAKLAAASAKVSQLRSRSDSAAAEAYKRATGLGPLDSYAHDLHQFGMLAPGFGAQTGSQEAARDLLRAEAEEQAARKAADDARAAADAAKHTFAAVEAEFTAKNSEYVDLRTRNDADVQRIQAQQDAYEESLGAPNLAASPVIEGMQAHPKALQALNFAMSKIGSWYVWGDEGPNTFDCSGLAYWSYGLVGVRVPRVANDMYHGTPAVRASKNSFGDQLLPGDLVYFATDKSDWRSIYHMGIYIGAGKMVYAPTTGQKVKIGPVTWSRFFGATRIFPAVAAPQTTQPAPTTAVPSSPPAPTTASPTAGPSATTSPSSTMSPSPSASPSPTTRPTVSTSPVTSSPAATSSASPSNVPSASD
jgi:peptidoglycan DL-endopeptidase CwlO